MTYSRRPGLGVGIGWRPEISGYVQSLPGLRFTEVVAESLHHPQPDLLDLRDRGVTVIPHGVQLSLGGPEPVTAERVSHLAHCAELLNAPLVSEHIAFVRAGGLEAGHLLPVPRTREALHTLVANIKRTQRELPVPLALEPIAALFDWPDAEYDEADFITELLLRTDALLLLDIANVYANARNRGEDPALLLDRLPLDRIAYVHVAGGTEADGLYHDTHTHPINPDVLALVTELTSRSAPPAFLLERDGHYPPAADLTAELDAIAQAGSVPSPTAPQAPAPTAAAWPAPQIAATTSTDDAPLPTNAMGRMGELVEALVAGRQAPEGFDSVRVQATARALLRKRADAVAKAWPFLARAYGQEWHTTFAQWARARPGRGSWLDGWDFARNTTVSDQALEELAACEARWHYDPDHTPRPRRLAARRLNEAVIVNIFGHVKRIRTQRMTSPSP